MSFFRMGSRFKHRSFDYVPRFYDPDKEEFENRIKGYNEESDAAEIAKSRIRMGFKRGGTDTRKYAQSVRKRSNRRLFYIIIFLVLASVLFLREFLPEIVKYVE